VCVCVCVRERERERERAAHKASISFVAMPLAHAGAENSAAKPVVVHFHGGGWKRGDRQRPFYGAPAMCHAYASNGFVAVAPSYR
jgi:acetyl esterase/lipase